MNGGEEKKKEQRCGGNGKNEKFDMKLARKRDFLIAAAKIGVNRARFEESWRGGK